MITLASDFGGPYPAAMKGVILRRSDARLVDVSHDLPRQDPFAAAFWLRFVLPAFPPAIHLAVVDPGVGTDRDAVVVRAGDHALVGPDNGMLLPPARALLEEADRDPDDLEVFRVDDVEEPASATFHGRDVFAPVAASVHEAGVETLESMGSLEPTEEYVDTEFPEPDLRRNADGETVTARGEVLVVDDFGNAITNVPGEALDGRVSAEVNGQPVPAVRTFAEAENGQRLVTVGSHGYVECDVRNGRGDDAFGLYPGASVELHFDTG